MVFFNVSRIAACVFGIALLLSIQLTIAKDESGESDQSGEPIFDSEDEDAQEGSNGGWIVRFPIEVLPMKLGGKADMIFGIEGLDTVHLLESRAEIRLVSSHPDIVFVQRSIPLEEIEEGAWAGIFGIHTTGEGAAELYVEIKIGEDTERSSQSMTIVVEKMKSSFIVSIATFLSSEYITYFLLISLFFNFGVVVNFENVKAAFVKPRGIIVAVLVNLLMIPVVYLSFALTLDTDFMQSIMIVMSGATVIARLCDSYSYTALLRGNIELSLSITLMNTVLSCGMITLLGFFTKAVVRGMLPNTFATVSMNIIFAGAPLVIGFLVQYHFPGASKHSWKAIQWVLAPIACNVASSEFALGIWSAFDGGYLKCVPILAAFAATFGSNLVIVLFGKLLRLPFEDCSAIAAEILTKIPALTYFLFAVLSKGQPGHFTGLFHDAIGIFIPVALLSNILWKYLWARFTTPPVFERA